MVFVAGKSRSIALCRCVFYDSLMFSRTVIDCLVVGLRSKPVFRIDTVYHQATSNKRITRPLRTKTHARMQSCQRGFYSFLRRSVSPTRTPQEFNVCDMEFDVAMKPQFSAQTIVTLLRYRRFLFDTQLYVQVRLQSVVVIETRM